MLNLSCFSTSSSLPPLKPVSPGEAPREEQRKEPGEKSAKNSRICQEFVKAVRENLPEPEAPPSEMKTISPYPIVKCAAEAVIQSLSLFREEDEFTYAIKVNEAFTELRKVLSCSEKKVVSKFFNDFFTTLVPSLESPTNRCPLPELLSLESSVKRIQQSLLLCSAELQLEHSSFSINPYLMEIKNKLIDLRDTIRRTLNYQQDGLTSSLESLPPSRTLPQPMVDALLGHLIPSANATQTRSAFLSLALNVVKERLEILPNLSSEEATRALIDIILFVHEAEDQEFAPTPSLEDKLDGLKALVEPHIFHALQAKVASFMRGEYRNKVPCDSYVTELKDLVEQEEKLIKDQIEKGGVCHEIEADAHLVTERELILKGAEQTMSGNFLYIVTPAPGSRLCTTHPHVNTFFYKEIEELRMHKQIIESSYAWTSDSDFLMHKREVQLAQERYAEICQELAREVKISRQVPDALPIEIVRTPETQGLLMEYIDNIPLEYICHNTLEGDPQQLKINMKIASLICKALERMHKAGYVHLKVDPSHILIEKKNGSYSIKLIDFRASVPEGGVARSVLICRYRSVHGLPPDLKGYVDYFIAHASMDNLDLAGILIEIFYGPEIKEEFMKDFLILINSKLLEWAHQEFPAAYAPYDLRRSPWENVKILVQKFLGTNPEIAAVILPLVHPDPESRGTAGQAAERLQQILGTMG